MTRCYGPNGNQNCGTPMSTMTMPVVLVHPMDSAMRMEGSPRDDGTLRRIHLCANLHGLRWNHIES